MGFQKPSTSMVIREPMERMFEATIEAHRIQIRPKSAQADADFTSRLYSAGPFSLDRYFFFFGASEVPEGARL